MDKLVHPNQSTCIKGLLLHNIGPSSSFGLPYIEGAGLQIVDIDTISSTPTYVLSMIRSARQWNTPY